MSLTPDRTVVAGVPVPTGHLTDGPGADGRRCVLHLFADAVLNHAARLAAVETADNGALPVVAEHVFVPRSAQGIRSYADWACELNREVLAGPVVDNHIRYA